jgi:hypothetical protein
MPKNESQNGSRTHEPSLRELTAELEGLKELTLEKFTASTAMSDERDRRYEERFKAMDEKTGLALTSSEKAVAKAETATEKRFDAVNEFRGQLKDQASTLLPKAEADAKFRAYDEKLDDIKKEIASLREYRSSGESKEKTMEKSHDAGTASVRWGLGMMVTIIFSSLMFLLGIVGAVFTVLKFGIGK